MTGARPLDRAHGLLGRGGQARDGVGRAADDVDVVVELGAQVVELAALVLVAESRSAGEQFVVDVDLRAPPELRVEGAQQRVLAPRGGGEIGCAVDDAVVGRTNTRPTVGQRPTVAPNGRRVRATPAAN